MRTMPIGRAVVAAGVGVVSLLLATRALAAVDCQIACTPPTYTACTCVDTDMSDPCVITTVQTMFPGAVVDCSGVDVILQSRIDVTNGVVTLKADDLTIASGDRIRARRTVTNLPFGMIVELSGSAFVAGVLEAQSNFGGGSIELYALGDIIIGDSSGGNGVVANATASGADGGRVVLASGNDITLVDPITANGSSQGETRGGTIVVEADRHVTVQTQLSVAGQNLIGGDIDLVAVNGTLDVQACGTCDMKAEGRGSYGDGGSIYLGGQRVVSAALISAQGGVGTGGGASAGGSVAFEASTGGIEILADVDVTGGGTGSGAALGGAIVAESQGDITVGNGVDLDTRSDGNGGDGGDIRLAADGDVTIGSARLDVRGSWAGSDEGIGATVEIEGCDVAMAAGATIDARGFDGGNVTFTARELLTISSTASINTSAVGGTRGDVLLEYRAEGRCSSGSPVACDPGQCATEGFCEGMPTTACTSDAQCDPCTSGQCTLPNPNTAGTVAQFVAGPPDFELNRALEACN